MTPSSLRPAFNRAKRNTGDVGASLFYDWCDEINRFAYRIIYGQEPERYMTSQTITVTSGTASYALSASVEKFDLQGCGVFAVENGVDTDRKLAKTGFGSQESGYYLDGSNIVLTPVPTESVTYKLRYIPTISAVDGESDVLVVPDSYLYYVLKALEVRYAVWEEDAGMEGMADQRFVRALDELAEHIRMDTPVYGINTYAQAYY